MEIKWSYGQVVVIEKDANPDPSWRYGIISLYYEYEAAGGASPLPIIMQTMNQFNGGSYI